MIQNKKKIILNKTIKYYEKSLKKYGSNYKGMNWSSKKSQYFRFEKLQKIAELNNFSVHDIGCGDGEFFNYLKKKKIKPKFFLGTDISEEMIKICKIKFTKEKKILFKHYNILGKNKISKMDFVLTSGIFNVKNSFSNSIWKDYVFETISKMYQISNKGIGFNFLTFDTTFRDKKLFYMSIDELIRFLRKKISKKIIIHHDYELWEYTVFVYK